MIDCLYSFCDVLSDEELIFCWRRISHFFLNWSFVYAAFCQKTDWYPTTRRPQDLSQNPSEAKDKIDKFIKEQLKVFHK